MMLQEQAAPAAARVTAEINLVICRPTSMMRRKIMTARGAVGNIMTAAVGNIMISSLMMLTYRPLSRSCGKNKTQPRHLAFDGKTAVQFLMILTMKHGGVNDGGHERLRLRMRQRAGGGTEEVSIGLGIVLSMP